jgi:hypothetical protein
VEPATTIALFVIHASTGRRWNTSAYAANETASSGGKSGGRRDSTIDDGSTDVTSIQYTGNSTIATSSTASFANA